MSEVSHGDVQSAYVLDPSHTNGATPYPREIVVRGFRGHEWIKSMRLTADRWLEVEMDGMPYLTLYPPTAILKVVVAPASPAVTR